jgi:ferredoxin
MSPKPKAKITIHCRDKKTEHVLRQGFGFQAIPPEESLALEFDCREADCGICIMKVLTGMENLSPPTEREADFLKAMHADPDERLACQVRVFGDVELEVETF